MFNPKDYFSSEIFAKFISGLDDLNGKYILDMGCGSGVVSVFAASKGARCIAVDVNPVSIKAAEENAKKNGFGDKIKALQSNLFENIPPEEKFDIIFFNPPYYEKEPKTDFEKAFFTGEGFKVIKNFLKQAKNHFASGCFIYFITSPIFLGKIKDIINRSINNTQNGFLIFYQGNIDRKFAVPLDKFFGPVKRVDQPKMFPVFAYIICCMPGFF